jgi:hypothetical protein
VLALPQDDVLGCAVGVRVLNTDEVKAASVVVS